MASIEVGNQSSFNESTLLLTVKVFSDYSTICSKSKTLSKSPLYQKSTADISTSSVKLASVSSIIQFLTRLQVILDCTIFNWYSNTFKL